MKLITTTTMITVHGNHIVCSTLLVLLTSLFQECRADMMLTIDNVKVFAGQIAIVGVYASSNSGDILTGFNLPLDINNDGARALPSGFTYDAATIANPIFANTGYDIPLSAAIAGVDAIPTGSGGNIVLSIVPTKLFDLRMAVAADVAAGTVVPIAIKIPAAPLATLFNVAGYANGDLAAGKPIVLSPTAGAPAFGSITVTAIPEPSTLALLALGTVGGVRMLRRRRT